MIIEDKVVEIDNVEYRIQPFPAFKGLVILKKLTKILAPSMSTMFTEVDSQVMEMDNLEKAVTQLVSNFDDDTVEVLIRDLIKSVTRNGQPLAFDIEFMADYGRLLKLVKEVVMVNYSTVFQAGGFLKG